MLSQPLSSVATSSTVTSPSELFERDFKRTYLDKDPLGTDFFQRSQTLGFGTSGAVFKVTNTDLSTTHALKCLSKIRPREKFANEVNIMQTIGYHPNIVSLVYAFEDRNYYNIVMELCKGGELTDVLVQSAFTEQQASYYVRQILGAISHCHERGIVHRDIKPGNFIVQELGDKDSEAGSLKMIDFGTALRVRDDEVVKGRAGTLLYSAPELFSDKYRRGRTGQVLKAADMWSLGVLLFVMVCGRPPFECDNSDDLIDAIVAGKYEYPPSVAMSDSVKDLLSRLLTTNPQQRLTAQQALRHPWVVTGANVPISTDVMLALEAFVTRSKLKKLVGKVMANQLTVRDENYLLSIFTRFDRDGDGRLGAKELTDFMRHLGHSTLDSELEADRALSIYSHRPSCPLVGYVPDSSCPSVSSESSSLSPSSSPSAQAFSVSPSACRSSCGNGNRGSGRSCTRSGSSSNGRSRSGGSSGSNLSCGSSGNSCCRSRSGGSSSSNRNGSIAIPTTTSVTTTTTPAVITASPNGTTFAPLSTNSSVSPSHRACSPISDLPVSLSFSQDNKALKDRSQEVDSACALVIHTRPGLDFADFEEMYTTGRLSISSQAMLDSFRHFDRGQKGYISRTDLENRASFGGNPLNSGAGSSFTPCSSSSADPSPVPQITSASASHLSKRSRFSDFEMEREDIFPRLVNQAPVVLSAVENSEDGKLSFVEWVLAMQEVDLPLLLSQHIQPPDAALVLGYLGRSVVLSRLNFLQAGSTGSELQA